MSFNANLERLKSDVASRIQSANGKRIRYKKQASFVAVYNATSCQSRIIGFAEKRPRQTGLINGGIYLIDRHIFSHPCRNDSPLPAQFSFETDFLQSAVNQIQVHGFISEGYFIDIGIPEDYQRAQHELGEVISA